MRSRAFLPIFLLCGAVFTSAAVADDLGVIELQHTTADRLLPVLRPLLSASSSLSGTGSTLILRAGSAETARLLRVIKKLDVAPERLQISVLQGEAAKRALSDTQVRIKTRGNVRIIAGKPPAPEQHGVIISGDGISLEQRTEESAHNNQATQKILTVSGQPAFIHYGELVPVSTPRQRYIFENGKRRILESETIHYKEAVSGFYVTPQLSGENVTLDLSTESTTRSKYPARSPNFAVSRVSTTVHGRLGEWISIGSVADERTEEGKTILGRTRQNASTQRTIALKVERLP